MDDAKLYGLIAAAVPDDPRMLAKPLVPNGFADRLADAWKAKFGKRVKVPQELITLAKKELETDDDLGKILAALSGDDDVWFLKPDLRAYPELGGWGDQGLHATKARELHRLAVLAAARRLRDPRRDSARDREAAGGRR
jgi:hypothetical protein